MDMINYLLSIQSKSSSSTLKWKPIVCHTFTEVDHGRPCHVLQQKDPFSRLVFCPSYSRVFRADPPSVQITWGFQLSPLGPTKTLLSKPDVFWRVDSKVAALAAAAAPCFWDPVLEQEFCQGSSSHEGAQISCWPLLWALYVWDRRRMFPGHRPSVRSTFLLLN